MEVAVVCPTCGTVVRQVALPIPSELTIPCACGMGVTVELIPHRSGLVTVGAVRPFDPRPDLGADPDDPA